MADNVNRISQDNYDEIVNEMDKEQIRCNECSQYGFNINCYYYPAAYSYPDQKQESADKMTLIG